MNRNEPVAAILTALRVEAEAAEERLTNGKEHIIQGLRFATGLMGGKPCVVAQSGVGKVNAAMAATLLIEHFKPRKVICMGAGGGVNPSLFPGDIVIAEKTVQHDYGILKLDGFRVWQTWSPVNGGKNPLFIPADTRLLGLAEMAACRVELPKVKTDGIDRTPNIIKGVIATGDVVVMAQSKRTELREDFKADAIDMEGAAVAQVCRQLGVAGLIIRSISDTDENIDWDIMKVNLKIASQNAARLVIAIVDEIST